MQVSRLNAAVLLLLLPLSPVALFLQAIGAEIAAHEATVEEMRRRNVANLPPPTTDGKAARGGTMLDQLQVTLTPAGDPLELPTGCGFVLYIYKSIKHCL